MSMLVMAFLRASYARVRRLVLASMGPIFSFGRARGSTDESPVSRDRRTRVGDGREGALGAGSRRRGSRARQATGTGRDGPNSVPSDPAAQDGCAGGTSMAEAALK